MRNAFVTWRANALRIVVRESAERGAPAVVFCHGIGMSASHYATLVPGADFLAALRDEGLNVMALDFQGHGLSGGRAGHLPFRDALGNIREAVSYALERFGGAPVGLAGSGLGGFLALYAALEDDRVGGVACHTIADLRDVSSFEPRARRRALAYLVGRARRFDAAAPFVRLPVRAVLPMHDFFEDEDNLARWRASKRATRRYTLDSLVSLFLTPDDKPSLESVTTPVFAIAGEMDKVVPLAGQQEAAARAGAELYVVGGAGHMLPLEHLKETAPRMGAWLRKVL
jgi:pimeloyl-ACP methyl ester carboxylesterase